MTNETSILHKIQNLALKVKAIEEASDDPLIWQLCDEIKAVTDMIWEDVKVIKGGCL